MCSSTEIVPASREGATSGDYSKEDPPVPIPNTVVKLFSAHDTGVSRESRTLPELCRRCFDSSFIG